MCGLNVRVEIAKISMYLSTDLLSYEKRRRTLEQPCIRHLSHNTGTDQQRQVAGTWQLDAPGEKKE